MSDPIVVATRAELDRAVDRTGTVALVPTMGALHDGHLALLQHGRRRGDTLVASIFVNPAQFGPGEDFADYPRPLVADLERCARAGVDVAFVPELETMYPLGPDPTVSVDPGPLGTVLEGAERPTHFRGVLTVVAKLFALVRPDVAVFGEKDYQQLVLISRMVRELRFGIEIEGCPTVREPDGLALSSRNVALDDTERRTAAALSAALRAGADAAEGGAEKVLAAARAVLDAAGIDPDYVALTDTELGPPVPGDPARLLVAARVGSPRLIDNTALTLGPGGA